MIKYVILTCSLLLLINCKSSAKEKLNTLPYYKDASFTPYWFASNNKELKKFHKIPTFNLINQLGDTITNKTFDNKIYITDFFFTSCPGICPKMTANMSIVQEKFKLDTTVLLLSHSVTPEKDSVPLLKRYANNKGVINNKWHLVTGSKNEIYTLGRKFYFVEEDLGIDKTNDDFLHTENFILIDKNKYIRGIYNGLNKTSVNQLIEDIVTLKKED